MRVEDYPDLTFFFVKTDSMRGHIFATLEKSLSFRAIMSTFPKEKNVVSIEFFQGKSIDLMRRNGVIALAETHALYHNEEDFRADYLLSKLSGLKQ